MATESKVSIEECIKWKSSQTDNNAHTYSRDTSTSEDSEMRYLGNWYTSEKS